MQNLKKIVFGILAMLVMVTSVNATEVDDLAELNACITLGGECTLTKDIMNLDAPVEIDNGKTLTIDLGGHSIAGTAVRFFNIKSGNVTIKNGLIINSNDDSDDGIIYVYGNTENSGKTTVVNLEKDLTIEGITGVVVSTLDPDGACYGVKLDIAATIINNKTHSSDADLVDSAALTIQGKIKSGDVVVNITGNLTGEIDDPTHPTANAAGIFQAGLATINVKEGAVVKGNTGIVSKSGELNITGAKVLGTGKFANPSAKGNGFSATGAAIQVETNNSYAGNINVNIKDSEIVSSNNSAIQAYDAGRATDQLKGMKVEGNSKLSSAENKPVVEASASYSLEHFIGEGTALEGDTTGIEKYLPENSSINKNGEVGKNITITVDKVIDPVGKADLDRSFSSVAGNKVRLGEFLGINKLNLNDYKDYTAVITVKYGENEPEVYTTNEYSLFVIPKPTPKTVATIINLLAESEYSDSFVMPSENVVISVEFVKTETLKTYTVEVVTPENGELTVDKTEAKENDVITVTVKADEGYKVDKVLVNGEEITADEEGNYSFVMPAENVTVSAVITKDETPVDPGQTEEPGNNEGQKPSEEENKQPVDPSGDGETTDPGANEDNTPSTGDAPAADEGNNENPSTLDSIVSIVTLAISSLGTAGYSIKKFIRK